MDKQPIASQRSVFFQVNTKQKRVEWDKDFKRFNKKSIYSLTWNGFYKELRKLGMKELLKQYGYSYKKKLQLDIAKSNLYQRKITLYDFEKKTEQELYHILGNSFIGRITRHANFNPKNHKLSSIHHYIHHHSLYFTAISLGFSSTQCFLNFFAKTLYIPECVGNMAHQNLKMSIESLHRVAPATLRKELAYLYDEPLVKNKDFLKYNYTLEELKLALENEDTMLVVASLGGGNVYYVNRKLQQLSPVINISLQDLRLRSWKDLKKNTPVLFWKLKLYQLFSGKISFEYWGQVILGRPNPLHRSSISFHRQFSSSQCSQILNVERSLPSNFHNPH